MRIKKNSEHQAPAAYEAPVVEVINMAIDSPILSTSTENFNTRMDYDGEWA